MHNYRRQQQIAAHPQPGIRDVGIEIQENDAEMIVEFECPSILPPGRWSKHPFDRFPTTTQPYMHDLLDLCKSIAPHLSDRYLQVSYDIIVQDFADFADAFVIVTSAVADHAYQIEAYWGFNPTEKFWVPLALNDSALLNSILFCSDQFGTKMNGQKERPSAINHLNQTIRILNERLQDSLQDISASTIAAVALLALTEVCAPAV